MASIGGNDIVLRPIVFDGLGVSIGNTVTANAGGPTNVLVGPSSTIAAGTTNSVVAGGVVTLAGGDSVFAGGNTVTVGTGASHVIALGSLLSVGINATNVFAIGVAIGVADTCLNTTVVGNNIAVWANTSHVTGIGGGLTADAGVDHALLLGSTLRVTGDRGIAMGVAATAGAREWIVGDNTPPLASLNAIHTFIIHGSDPADTTVPIETLKVVDNPTNAGETGLTVCYNSGAATTNKLIKAAVAPPVGALLLYVDP